MDLITNYRSSVDNGLKVMYVENGYPDSPGCQLRRDLASKATRTSRVWIRRVISCLNFSSSHVSEYWYTLEHVFGFSSPYVFVRDEHAASHFCSQEWDGVVQVKQHDTSYKGGLLSGAGR